MDEIVYKLPKGIELSDYLKGEAVLGAYFKVMHYGYSFYVPITKGMKKIFGMKILSGKFIYEHFDSIRIGDLLRQIIDGVYLQIRDNVCVGIESHLEQELKEGFAKLFEKQLHKMVKTRVVKALPFSLPQPKRNK